MLINFNTAKLDLGYAQTEIGLFYAMGYYYGSSIKRAFL
jgi:hypothetical protein